jgi:hypothetical protein
MAFLSVALVLLLLCDLVVCFLLCASLCVF